MRLRKSITDNVEVETISGREILSTSRPPHGLDHQDVASGDCMGGRASGKTMAGRENRSNRGKRETVRAIGSSNRFEYGFISGNLQEPMGECTASNASRRQFAAG
jgi:hypothetical protein